MGSNAAKILTFVALFICCSIFSAESCSEGYAPNPPECISYLECVHGTWIKRNCPDGLYWNNKGKYCDWPSSSGCTPGGDGGSNPTTTQSPTPPPSTGKGMINENEFKCAAKTKDGYPDNSYYQGFINSISKALIKDRSELAKYLAHSVWETVGFKYTKEVVCQQDLERCRRAYPNTGKGRDDKVYYGRGMLQLTWDYNYDAASRDLYGDDRLIQNPDQVGEVPEIGWDTASWYWKANVHSVSQTFGSTLKAINGALECDGGPNSQNRILRFNHYKEILTCLNIAHPPESDGYCRA